MVIDDSGPRRQHAHVMSFPCDYASASDRSFSLTINSSDLASSIEAELSIALSPKSVSSCTLAISISLGIE